MKRVLFSAIPISILLLLAVLACSCSDQDAWLDTEEEFAVNLNLSTNKIYIGQIVEVDLDILHPKGTQPNFTEPDDNESIMVRDRTWNNRELEDGRRVTSIRYKLTSFELGEHRIFKDEIAFMEGEEQVGSLDFEGAVISVESALEGADADMRSIAGCEPFKSRFPRWLPVLIGIALIAALVGAVVARLWGKRKPEAEEPARPPAHEIAMRELRLLWQKGWIEENAVEPFYVELSRIVREYIENRFDLRAPEQTTEEFIRDASRSVHLSPEHRELTADFLRQSDMVKFARYRPAADMMKEAYDSAERLVEETAQESPSATTEEDAQ